MNEKELRGKVEQLLLAEKIKQLREKGYEQEMRAFVLAAKEKQLEYEYRYNHYHDPHNGRFASGAGGGTGLYYSMGKGKGEIVGAASAFSGSNMYNKDKISSILGNKKDISEETSRFIKQAKAGDTYTVKDRWGNTSTVTIDDKYMRISGASGRQSRYKYSRDNVKKYLIDSQTAKLTSRNANNKTSSGNKTGQLSFF